MAIDISVNDVGQTPQNKRRPVVVREARLTPRGYKQLALDSSGKATWLNSVIINGEPFIPPGANILVLNVEGGPIRYRDDGEPTDSSTGELWPAGTGFTRTLRDLKAICLSATASGCIVNVSFYECR